MKCLKHRYPTKAIAKKYLKQINKQHTADRKLTNVYYCELCTGFHLTSQPKQASRDYTRYLNKKKH